MTKKITTVILTGLTLITIAPNARAEIASKQYVDDQTAIMVWGEFADAHLEDGDSPTERLYDYGGIDGMLDTLETTEDVADRALEAAEQSVSVTGQTYDGFLISDGGDVKIATGGYITNAKVASNAAIEMGKIALPTPPAVCETSGCMLMYYDGKYVWESVTRNTNESISTTGYVNATATSTSTSNRDIHTAGCLEGEIWNGDSCMP